MTAPARTRVESRVELIGKLTNEYARCGYAPSRARRAK